MTFKEKLMKEEPHLVSDDFKGGAWGCPFLYGYCSLNRSKCGDCKRWFEANPAEETCRACWNQKMGPSAWQIMLIVFGALALLIGLIGFGIHVFAAAPPTDTVDIPVVDTLEIPLTDEPIESIEEPVVETIVEETLVETLEETATDIVETAIETMPKTESKPEAPIVTELPKGTPVTLVATAYCGENYPHICNDGDSSKTATGTKPQAGRTIAVDPRMIPYGSKVIINGITYIAEDCGGAINGNRIDIFFDTHQEALQWGRRTVEAIIITEN